MSLNSKISHLPNLLVDISSLIGEISRTENLSAQGQNLLMAAGRLLEIAGSEGVGEAGSKYSERGLLLLAETGYQAPSDAEAIDASLLRVLASTDNSVGSGRELRVALLRRYLEDVEAHQSRLSSLAGTPASERELSPDEMRSGLLTYLSHKAGRPITRLKRFERIPGGYSKGTLAVELHPEDEFGWGTRWVVRHDVKNGPTSFRVADEYSLLKEVEKSAVPLPRPIACESDSSILGNPFMISALVPGVSARSGDYTVEAWQGDQAFRHHLGEQMARSLGTLHSIRPRLDADVVSAEDHVRAYIGEWRQRWLSQDASPDPAMTMAFEWLENNVPHSIEKLAYIHGDFAPYNALQHHGTITGIIDWEFAHLGDPAEDVGYCKSYMESLMPWESFLKAYYDAGGPTYHEESASFYEIWCNVRNAVVLLQGRMVYVKGLNPDLKTFYASAEFYELFLSRAVAGILSEIT